MDKYLSAKEYIDTVVIPVQAFQLSEDKEMKQDAFQGELLDVFSKEIEKELSGRVLLTPTYYYLKSADLHNEIERLNTWLNDFKKQPFKEIFIFTFDKQVKKLEKEIPCQLIWFPGMKVEDIKSQEAGKLIRNQVEQISELIKAYW